MLSIRYSPPTAKEDALTEPSTTTGAGLILQHGRQRLHLLPEHGGSIAAWDLQRNGQWQPLMRPWDGAAPDAYTFACFPLVPWSNRIGSGGFEQDGVFHAVRPNRLGEPYPIHGDGWLQAWRIDEQDDAAVTLALDSRQFDGNPHHYRATQRFAMTDGRLTIALAVTHLGDQPLPYGLGLHPYFLRDGNTRLQMACDGLWLCGDDPMPVSHSTDLPATFDYRQPAPLVGPLIDNCFTGWDGRATISYLTRGLTIELTMRDCAGYALMYRPPGLDYFCLEPITHPIDAFHMAQRPGLRLLKQGDSMSLTLELLVRTSEG